MKKKFVALALSGCMALSCAVFADEKDDRIAELEARVAELEAALAEAQGPASTNQDSYAIGETWVVEGQWEITVTGVEETSSRNEYSDYNPAAVYIVSYSYKNLGYEDPYWDGLYIGLDDGIVDAAGKMGYSYPGDVAVYPQETPIGASCDGQACIGVDNAGSFEIHFSKYDGNDDKHSTVFHIDV